MLKKINNINHIRNLLNFSSDEDFGKKNIIYARNGTGKSNITEFLQCLNSISPIKDIEEIKSLESIENGGNIEFNLDFDTFSLDKNNLSLNNSKLHIFNENFVADCIKLSGDFSDKSHDGVIYLSKVGKSNIEIEKLKKIISTLTTDGLSIKKIIEKNIDEKILEISKNYNAQKTTIKEILNYENWKNVKYIDSINSDDNVLSSLADYKAIKKINENDKINNNLKELGKLDDVDIRSILFTKFDFDDVEEEIENHINNVVGKEWIKSGLLYSDDNDNCPFCRQEIKGLNILKQYKEFIESSKSKTFDKINNLIDNLILLKKNIEQNSLIINSGLKKKITDYSKLFDLGLDFYDLFDIDDIDLIINALKDKKVDLLKEFDETEINTIINKIESSILKYNDLAQKNNKNILIINNKLGDTSKRKTDLRRLIAKKELVDIYNLNIDKLKKIESIGLQLVDKKKELSYEGAKGPETKKKELIINNVNWLLKMVHLDKYEIDNDFNLLLKNSTNNFKISDKTHILSSGEKIVISYCYFISSVLQYVENITDLENITLIIDDPVESTSYNYMHAIGTIIGKLSTLFNDSLQYTGGNCYSPQYIILTHNLQFYNFISSSVVRGNKLKRFRLLSKDGFCTGINEIKDEKMSEYDTSIIRLIRAVKGEINENVGGDIRRILETICGFHSMHLEAQSIEKIFGISNISAELHKYIAHDFTHTDFNNYEDPLDSVGYENVINEVYNNLKSKFPEKIKIIEDKL